MAEVHRPTFSIRETTFVKELEEDIVYIGMRLLDLIEENDSVWLETYGLGEFATFSIADIARRRANQSGDREALGQLAHINTHKCLLATKDLLSKRLSQIGLPYPSGS